MGSGRANVARFRFQLEVDSDESTATVSLPSDSDTARRAPETRGPRYSTDATPIQSPAA